MSDVKISQLPASSSLDGTEVYPMVKSGSTMTATGGVVAQWLSSYFAPLSGYNNLVASLAAYESNLASSTPGSGVDLVGGSIRVVDSVSDIRNLPKTGCGRAIALGYYSPAGQGGGEFYLDPADTTSSDNGATVIVNPSDGGRWKLVYRGFLSPAQCGARFDGGGDDTAAWNLAISILALAGGGTILCPLALSSRIAGTILLPSNITINLNGCTLIGAGTASNNIFESAYVSGSTVVSNIATTPNTVRVINTNVYGGNIQNCARAFNLLNFNENSAIHDIEFSNCGYAVYSSYPYYSSYFRLVSRGTAGGAANAAFYWTTFVNECKIESIFCVGRALSYRIDGGSYGMGISNCSAESCTAGWIFQGTVHSLKFFSNYFENVSANALEFSGAGSSFFGIDIDANWFNLTNTCVSAINFTGRWGRNNRRNGGNCTVDFSASTNYAEIEPPRTYVSTNITAPGLPTGFSAGIRCIVNTDDTLYNNGTGNPTVRARNFGGTLTPLMYWGDPGEIVTNTVAFSTVSNSGGTTNVTVYVDTNITVRKYTCSVYNIAVADNSGTTSVYGRIHVDHTGALIVKADDASGKTVVASNNGGKLRIAISAFANPSAMYNATGTVRMI